MPVSDAFNLRPPTQDDLNAAESAWRDGTLRYVLAAGSVYWRTVKAPTRDEARKYARVCFPSTAESRFAPITINGGTVPMAYAASTPTTSIWEVPLRDVRHKGIKRVPTQHIANFYLVKVYIARDLQLLDLRRPAISNLVGEGRRPPDLTAASPDEYDATRIWAQALYDRLQIDGFIYESHHVPGDCIVLFQPDDVEVFEPIGDAMALDEEPVRSLLRREASKAGIVVDFGDVLKEE